MTGKKPVVQTFPKSVIVRAAPGAAKSGNPEGTGERTGECALA
jgi:hypothetical protein